MPFDFKSAALDYFRHNTEEFHSDVTDVTDANLKSPEMAYYPKKLVAAYKKDYAVVEKMYDKCDAVFEEMQNKEITVARVKKADAAISAFNTSILILEQSNAMFSAHNKHKTASQAAGMLELFALIVKSQQAQAKKLADDLPKLVKELKSAKRAVRGAKAQRAVNLAITGVTACIPATKAAHIAIVVVAATSARLIADASLGVTGPDAGAAVKTTAGEFAGAVDLLGKGSGKLMSAVGAIDALVADGKEIAGAEKELKSAKKSLKDVEKRLKDLERNMRSSNKTLQKIAPPYAKATKAAADAMSKYKASKRKRADLKKELLD